MSKPNDIPQDIWLNACKALGEAESCTCDLCVTPIARAIMAERERFRPILTDLYGDVVWSAYAQGIVREDGKWTDAAMSDAEQLRRDLGVADVPQPDEAMRAALPLLIERKVDAALRGESA